MSQEITFLRKTDVDNQKSHVAYYISVLFNENTALTLVSGTDSDVSCHR